MIGGQSNANAFTGQPRVQLRGECPAVTGANSAVNQPAAAPDGPALPVSPAGSVQGDDELGGSVALPDGELEFEDVFERCTSAEGSASSTPRTSVSFLAVLVATQRNAS